LTGGQWSSSPGNILAPTGVWHRWDPFNNVITQYSFNDNNLSPLAMKPREKSRKGKWGRRVME